MPLIHVDVDAILNELVDLKTTLASPMPGMGDPSAGQLVRQSILRLQALLPAEWALAENVSPLLVRRLSELLNEIEEYSELADEEKAFLPTDSQYRRLRGLVWEFHKLSSMNDPAKSSEVDSADAGGTEHVAAMSRENQGRSESIGRKMRDYERVTDAARVCCQHLYSFHGDAPHSSFFSVDFDADELQGAMQAGQEAIQPLKDDFGKVAATIVLPGTGGRGVQMCGITRQTAHGLAFGFAEKLLHSIERGDGSAFFTFSDIQGLWVRIRNEARDVAELIGSNKLAGDATDVECHVTLSQMAAIVNRTKRTLEFLKASGKLPSPSVKGGKGKPDEWIWSEVRSTLSKEYGRELPEIFPADRFVRR